MVDYVERMLARARGQRSIRAEIEAAGEIGSRAEKYAKTKDTESLYISRLQHRLRRGEVEGNPFKLWAIAYSNPDYLSIEKNIGDVPDLKRSLAPGTVLIRAGRYYAGVIEKVDVTPENRNLALHMSLNLQDKGPLANRGKGFYEFAEGRWYDRRGLLELTPGQVGVYVEPGVNVDFSVTRHDVVNEMKRRVDLVKTASLLSHIMIDPS